MVRLTTDSEDFNTGAKRTNTPVLLHYLLTSQSLPSVAPRRITPFILSNGLGDSSTVGTIAGWIESAYSAGVLLGLAPASYLSDGIGRKPTAITGVLLASVGTIAFGFARTLPQMIALRFSIGVFVAFIPA